MSMSKRGNTEILDYRVYDYSNAMTVSSLVSQGWNYLEGAYILDYSRGGSKSVLYKGDSSVAKELVEERNEASKATYIKDKMRYYINCGYRVYTLLFPVTMADGVRAIRGDIVYEYDSRYGAVLFKIR